MKITIAKTIPNFSVPFRIFIFSYIPYFSFSTLAFLSFAVQHKELFGFIKTN